MNDMKHKQIPKRLWRSKLLLLIILFLNVSCYEVDMTVAVDEKNPSTFELSGSGNLNQFHVMEVPAWNQTQTIQRRSDVNILLWEVRPIGEDKIRRLPKITYGQVPAGFEQVFPADGTSPSVLVEGKVYEVGGTAYNANGGLIWIVVRGGKVVEIPITGSRG
jgi:hypothetical protein